MTEGTLCGELFLFAFEEFSFALVPLEIEEGRDNPVLQRAFPT